jgi:predicted transcriptional regulator
MEKQLTKAEEQVMQQLWQLKQSFLRELVDSFAEPGPHQNTVATILKTLHHKGFVSIESVGRNHLYIPTLSKDAYSKQSVQGLVKNYYKGSFSQLVSFFAKEKEISIEELEEILNQLKK